MAQVPAPSSFIGGFRKAKQGSKQYNTNKMTEDTPVVPNEIALRPQKSSQSLNNYSGKQRKAAH